MAGWGYTEYGWEHTYNTNSDGTKPTNVKVTTSVSVTMPNWPGYSKATVCMKGSWDAMYRGLQAHEDRHVTLGADVDGKIKKAIENVSVSDASELAAAVNSAAQAIRDANQAAQRQFDADTDHGKKDAVFTPC